VSSVLPRFTESDYQLGVFKLFLLRRIPNEKYKVTFFHDWIVILTGILAANLYMCPVIVKLMQILLLRQEPQII